MHKGQVILTRSKVLNPNFVLDTQQVARMQIYVQTCDAELVKLTKGSETYKKLTASRNGVLKQIKDFQESQEKKSQAQKEQELVAWLNSATPTQAELHLLMKNEIHAARVREAVNDVANYLMDQDLALTYISELDADIQDEVLDAYMDQIVL